MAEKKRRGCLGCSFPIVITVSIIAVAMTVVGFLAGAIGQKLFHVSMPSWLVVARPAPELPSPILFHVLGVPIANTTLGAFLTVVILVGLSYAITRKMKLVPGRLQAAFEMALGWIYDLCLSVAGDINGRKFFAVVCTIFLYVIINAWEELIPGFGSIMVHMNGHEYELLRGANTDINTPLAIAIISFVFVAYYGLKMLGWSWMRQYFDFGPFFRAVGRAFKGHFSVMDLFTGVVTIFVGLLEFLSRWITILSFTFRLFGNMTAGEILLLITAFLVPLVLALPFYGLELLIGFIQALIFAGLTLVFVTMAVMPHEDEA